MTDWYYHDPAQGRVGPFTAEELRRRFHDRRIRRDTLLWHHGLREWQPLERMALDLGLAGLQADGAGPPPLPGSTASPASVPTGTSHPAAARGKYARAPVRAKKTLPTGVVVLIAVAALAIPGAMILASIALPAYRDYVRRADSMGALTGMAIALKREVGQYALATGRCPGNDDPRVARMRAELQRRSGTDVRFDRIDGGCAFELAIVAEGKPNAGRSLRYEGHPDGDAFAWQCVGGDLPETDRPYECRSR